MDARTPSTSTAGHAPDQSPIDHDELRAILSNLSHELSRPLVSLRAGFDLLLTNAAWSISPEQRGHVQTMVAMCDNLLHLTQSYLDYAGLVRGSRPVCYGSYTISALIGEIDRQFAPVAIERRIAWSCSRAGADSLVATDPARCQQIFGNLVANALKYTPDGGRVRVVGCHEQSHWSVTVSDTGLGIPADAWRRSSSHSTASRVTCIPGRRGMGLAWPSVASSSISWGGRSRSGRRGSRGRR